jgi:hypothetical protein
MSRWLLVSLLVLTTCVSVSRADIPSFDRWGRPIPRQIEARIVPVTPLVKEQPKTRVVLSATRAEDKRTHIVLPGSLVGNPGRAAPPVDKSVGQGPSRPAVVVAGLALAGAFALGGLWLMRAPGKRLAGGLGMLAALGVVMLGVSGCPPFDRQDERGTVIRPVQNPQVRSGALVGEGLLEVDPDADAVRIEIDRNELAQFAAGAQR